MSPLDSSKSALPRAPRAPVEERPPVEENGGGIPPVLQDTPTMGALLAALRRRWLLALVVALVGGGLTVAALSQFVPGQYVSEARLKMLKPPLYMPSSADGAHVDEYIRGQAVLIRNIAARLVRGEEPLLLVDDETDRTEQKRLQDQVRNLNEQVRNLEMVRKHGEDTAWLTRALVMKPVAGENVLPIKLNGDDAHEAALFLNAVLSMHKIEIDQERRQQQGRLKKVLLKHNEKLAQLSKQLPKGDPREVDQFTIKLTQTRVDLGRAQSELKSRTVTPISIDKLTLADALDAALRTEPEALDLRQRIALKTKEISVHIATATKGKEDQGVRKMENELQGLQDEFRVLRDMLEQSLEKQLLGRARQARKTELEQLQEKVVRLEKEEEVLDKSITLLVVGQDPEKKALDAERKAVEFLRDGTQRTISEIKSHGQDIPWIQQLGAPTEPTTKDRSNQFKIVGVATFAVVGLLLFGVALVEFRGRRASSSKEVTQGLGIPTVGALPLLPASVRRAALSATAPRDLKWEGRLTESVDALRTYLLRALGEGPHVILVTSAVQGEGKTSLASQLAASLARAWRKTLLVDGDLRKPAAHQLFDLPSDPGFSEVLRGEMEPGEAIKPTPVSRLWLMPAGQWDAHAQQALAQEGVGNVFEHLKEEYDMIVVDSCPVLPVADTLLLGQHVDTVLLSVLKGTSRLPLLYAARQRLGALDIPVLGAVFAGDSGSLGGLNIQYPSPPAR